MYSDERGKRALISKFFTGLQLINIIIGRINYILGGIIDIRGEEIKFIKWMWKILWRF